MKIKHILFTVIAAASLTSHAVDGDSLKNAGILCLSGGTLLLSAYEFGKAFNSNQSLRDMELDHSMLINQSPNEQLLWAELPELDKKSANYPIVLAMYQDDIDNRSDRALKARNKSFIRGSILLALSLGVYGWSKS